MSFIEALKLIPPADQIMVARDARPPSTYLWSTVLPEVPKNSYYVTNKSMTVRTTMAGMVGMDSPYTPGGAVTSSDFLEQSTKLSLTITMGEALLREIQVAYGNGGGNPRALANEALNFYEKVCVQGVVDRAEWMRGQIMTTGSLTWTYNGITIDIDYGVPAANKLDARTVSNTDAYHLPGSLFWTDVREADRLLSAYGSVVGFAHPTTIDLIVSNSANNLTVASRDGGSWTLQRWVDRLGNPVESPDARDQITLISYGAEGEAIDTSGIFDGTTTKVPFCTPGKIVWVASGGGTGYRIGDGATREPRNALELGYTHVAPTVEGNGQPGRWGRIFTPEAKPWQLASEVVENMLPVVENPERIVIGQTEIV